MGPNAGWKELNGNYETHARLVEACINHDVKDRLNEISAPTLIIHAGKDLVTGPRTTLPLEEGIPNAEGVLMEDVAHVVAGKEQKIAFCEILFDFLERHKFSEALVFKNQSIHNVARTHSELGYLW